MDEEKVVSELREMMADPLLRASAKVIADRIEDGTRTGKIIISLLEVAENGGFK